MSVLSAHSLKTSPALEPTSSSSSLESEAGEQHRQDQNEWNGLLTYCMSV